ncbi:MAG: hypothetical protein ABI892_18700 [Flavobacterium sp.]
MICKAIVNSSKTYSKRNESLKDKKGGKSTYRFQNPLNKEYQLVDFEKDVFANDDTKCDYGIKTETEIFYIELKGCDVKKGIEQLLVTLNITEKCFPGLKSKARLIVTNFQKPALVRNTAEYKNLVKKLKHVYEKDDNLVIRTSFTENI